jgi:arylsulfatase
MDPYERADIVSDQYFDWLARNDFKLAQLTTHAAVFLQTFIEYPPSQEQASFSIDQIAHDVERQSRSQVNARTAQCPLLAQSGHLSECPLSGVKRTSR